MVEGTGVKGLEGGRFVSFEVLEESGEGLLVGGGVLPVGEVANVSMCSQVVCPVCGAGEDGVVEAEGVEDLTVLLDYEVEGAVDFVFDPGACDGVGGEEEEEFVLEVDGFVDFFAEVVARREVVGGEPAGDVVLAQVAVEAFGNCFILMRVTNEQRMVLNWSRSE